MMARTAVTAILLLALALLHLRNLRRRGLDRERVACLALWGLATAAAVAHAAGFQPPGLLGTVARALRPWGQRVLGPLLP